MKLLLNLSLKTIAAGQSFNYMICPGETQSLTSYVSVSCDRAGHFALNSEADLSLRTSGYLHSQQDPFMIYLRNNADDILSLQISRSGDNLLIKGFSVNG